MQHPFAVLKAEYTALLSQMRVIRVEEVEETARKLLNFVNTGHYDRVCMRTGVPQAFAAASFEREASSNFRLSPAQGDPWDRISTHVPRGAGPFASWEAAAEWTYRHEELDKVPQPWTAERACYEAELFNGMGYRARGVHSPYLWAGTDRYARGKFVADGRYDPHAIDQQIGVVPVMMRMAQINPLLAFAGPVPDPASSAAVPAPPPPAPAPEGLRDAEHLQKLLNELGAHLIVDGSYGRITRLAVRDFQRAHGLEADGLAGAKTWATLDLALNQAH